MNRGEQIVILNLALKASEETTKQIRAALAALGEAEEFTAEPAGSHREDFHPTTGPQASAQAELLTGKQFGLIRALSREAGVDPEEECQSFLRCPVDSLSKRAASSFIDHLKKISQEGERRAS